MIGNRKKWLLAVASSLLAASVTVPAAQAQDDYRNQHIRHVLLISIDGMHALDFINCSKGISEVNGGKSYCPNLAELAESGVNYLDTATSKPSDSFPGLMALMTGGSPRTVGAFYDVAYDRSLAPPKQTTGNGLAGGICTPGVFPGTTTEYDEGIDIDQTKLNGGASTGDGGIASIDASRLVRDPARLRTGVSLELRPDKHDLRCDSRRRRLHRMVRQASVILRSQRSWQRHERR